PEFLTLGDRWGIWHYAIHEHEKGTIVSPKTRGPAPQAVDVAERGPALPDAPRPGLCAPRITPAFDVHEQFNLIAADQQEVEALTPLLAQEAAPRFIHRDVRNTVPLKISFKRPFIVVVAEHGKPQAYLVRWAWHLPMTTDKAQRTFRNLAGESHQ